MTRKLFLHLFALLALSPFAFAQSKQRVRFAKNTSNVSVKGVVRGYDYIDYIVRSRAGQNITVKLSSPNTFSVFSIFLPNGDNLEGASQTAEFSGVTPDDGDYVIRVAMMRAEARRKNSTAAFTLKIAIH